MVGGSLEYDAAIRAMYLLKLGDESSHYCGEQSIAFGLALDYQDLSSDGSLLYQDIVFTEPSTTGLSHTTLPLQLLDV